MGLSITAMLAALASEIVIAARLPVAKEQTWIEKLSTLTWVYSFVSLLESVVVLYFYYKRNEDLGEYRIEYSYPVLILGI